MSIINTSQLDLFNTEVPEGFSAKSKDDIRERSGDRRNENICNWCDARILCQFNKDKWCMKYPCMSYRRQDGKSVYFKQV